MPRKLKLDSLRAELSSIISLLDEARGIDDPIGVIQYEYRMSIIEAEISELERDQETKASVALFFGGRPVFGSRGVSADFAGRALDGFQEIISKVYANLELGRMGSRGRVPLAGKTNLMITEVAKGSFGFVLDELNDQMEMADTALKKVVDDVAIILEKTGAIEDSSFEEVLEEIDDRTLISLKDFFKNLEKSEATLRVVEGSKEFVLDDDSVKRGKIRTESTFIDENEEVMEGVFIGFLPEHKKFEFKLNSGEVIWGTATKDVAESYANSVEKGLSIINKKWRAKFDVRVVKPLNRPTKTLYRLLEFGTKVDKNA